MWFGDRDQLTAASADIIGVEVTTAMTDSQTTSIIATIVAALIVLMLFFWATEFKPMLAVIAVLPIGLVLIWVLGTMALTGIPFNVITALITALSIGIGVDYTIHIIHRFTEELEHSGDLTQATNNTLRTTGSALVGSALTTALGFGVLLFSPPNTSGATPNRIMRAPTPSPRSRCGPRSMGTRPMAALTATGLTRRFGDLTAVDDLTFEAPAGGVVGFVGPNGSGKSTIMRVLLGLIAATEGTGTVLGEPIEHPERYANRVGALIEGPTFVGVLSAWDTSEARPAFGTSQTAESMRSSRSSASTGGNGTRPRRTRSA